MYQDEYIVALPPNSGRLLRGRGASAAHLAYRVGRGPRLLRLGEAGDLRGGLMVVGQGDYRRPGDPALFCREVVQECRSRGFSGAVLDFEQRFPFWERLAGRLDEVLARQGLRFFVPESYGQAAPHAGVLISSALSGGTLSGRLREAGERFGLDRVTLALERSAEDFTLPSPTGCGTPLSREELEHRLDTGRPCVFFSVGLCARYFTYMDASGGAHFVLFDDDDTMLRKVEEGRRAGVRRFFLPHTEARLLDRLAIDAGPRRG